MTKKYFLIGVLLIMTSACASKPVTTIIQNSNVNTNTNAEITMPTTNGEISDPGLVLPTDINTEQIQKYFSYRDTYYALVMQSSMNIVLDTPVNFKTQFVGVLKANKGDAAWSKFIEIKDKNATDKNNPYYLWQIKNQLRLTVVDQNGAGSGEGIMKIFAISDGKANLDGCYYYPGSDSAKNYFSNTRNFSKFESQPMESCSNADIKIF